MDDVIEDNLVLLDGDVELGKGVALVCDAGPHGRQPLPLRQHRRRASGSPPRTASRADSWHPHLSKIPGVRKYAEFFNREVVLNSNTLEDSIDQYDSMVKEKAIADPNRARPALAERLPVVGDGRAGGASGRSCRPSATAG